MLLFLLEEESYFPFMLLKPHPLSAELSPLGWELTIPATSPALDINRRGKGEGGSAGGGKDSEELGQEEMMMLHD